MEKLLVFQHVAYEILGTFHPLLKASRFRLRYANFGRHPDLQVDVRGYDGLVILGGPMGVYEADRHPHLTVELNAIDAALKAEIPILGICLGAQLIASALGAKVEKKACREVGWCDLSLTPGGKRDALLGELGEREKVFQWHQDGFDLPTGAEGLAKSDVCEHQAFRYGDRVYGFQFHLEVDEPMIERWLNLPAHVDWLPGGLGTRIREETPVHMPRLNQLSSGVFSKFIDLFDKRHPKIHLGSGHK